MDQLKTIYEQSLRFKKRFMSLAIIFFVIGNLCLIGELILYLLKVDVLLIPKLIEGLYLSNLLLELFTIFVSIGVMFVIFSYAVFARRARYAKMMMEQKTTVVIDKRITVDVEDVPEQKPSKYSNIISEYEKLYKQGLISKEDYEAKKKELENL